MNIITESEINFGTGELAVPKRYDHYEHIVFDELSSPELVHEAWRIHAEGYFSMGFINQDAIDANGFLPSDIDKARGDNVEYYMTISPNNINDCATLRKINIPSGKDLYALPAYKLCNSFLSQDGASILDSINDNKVNLKEIAALSRSNEASQKAVYELFRAALHDGIKNDEVWLFSLVSTTYESLSQSLGKRCFVELGEKVIIDDPRVSSELTLNPILFKTNEFIDTLHSYYVDATSDSERNKALRSFMFFSDGLNKELLSKDSYEFKQKIIEYFQGVA